MIFEHRVFRVAPAGLPELVKALDGPLRARVEAAGGTVWGAWRGLIGLGATEGVVTTLWPDRASVGRASADLLADVPGVVDHRAERFEPTVRPTDATPPHEDGVYAFRIFDILERDRAEFVQLSDGAWPDFESTYGVRVIGLFRSVDARLPEARMLLLTRYPSLAVWETSRGGTGAFVRRHQLTRATHVVTTVPLRPGGP